MISIKAVIERDDSYPFQGYPRGWFQIGWGLDFPVGEARPLHYFGRDLVAYRGLSDGAVHVLDGHCGHMGAHLGYGGRVEGDCVRCPFHGWLYDATGQNVDIPNSPRPYGRVRLRQWHVAELDQLVLIWHDSGGREPLWDPPVIPELGSRDRYPVGRELTHIWSGLRVRPQYIVENTVDIAHQKWVHHSPSEHELLDWEIKGPMFRSRQALTFGAGHERTWLTPDGPVRAELDVECWGIGFNVARFLGTDDSAHVASHTPIDERHIDERLTVLTKIEAGFETSPSPLALKRFRYEVKQFDFDVVIWEHMHYIRQPPWGPDEATPFRAFRKWAATFFELDEAVAKAAAMH
jgi:3-ketosteroid 9alpha-monooxygenase subunit A